MFTDIVSDLITQIRNASATGKEVINVRSSKVVVSIAQQLKTLGFIQGFEQSGYMLTITLAEDTPVSHIKRLSKPGIRRYVRSAEIPTPHSGLGTVLLSTPKGVMTGNQAKKQKVGGELICEVW
ncbi:MAG: 30S ribosomal protein S8 [Candidatus Berkelbacteria bacterium]|nr:MAG: 30S ribosomal protein S8 [Candidatus Berkelbacteria bacterium]QQG52106.1 MAG: 30S ribosomal protein S8 [Candidatus Berkelbacteria bacterium]